MVHNEETHRKHCVGAFGKTWVPPAPIWRQVATLAGSEFVAVMVNLESGQDQVRLASDWSLSMDIILTELKAGSLSCLPP